MNNNERTVTPFWQSNKRLDKGIVKEPSIPSRSLDRFDMEAEREGSARQYFNKNELKPILGRRIGKETRQKDGNGKTAAHKSHKNFIKDHAAAMNRLIIKEG